MKECSSYDKEVNVAKIESISIPVTSIDYFIEDVEQILKKYNNFAKVQVCYVKYKDKYNELQIDDTYKPHKYIADVTVDYTDNDTNYSIRYYFVDIFDRICFSDVKKVILNAISYFGYDDKYDVDNITTIKNEIQEQGIMFDIYKKKIEGE